MDNLLIEIIDCYTKKELDKCDMTLADIKNHFENLEQILYKFDLYFGRIA